MSNIYKDLLAMGVPHKDAVEAAAAALAKTNGADVKEPEAPPPQNLPRDPSITMERVVNNVLLPALRGPWSDPQKVFRHKDVMEMTRATSTNVSSALQSLAGRKIILQGATQYQWHRNPRKKNVPESIRVRRHAAKARLPFMRRVLSMTSAGDRFTASDLCLDEDTNSERTALTEVVRHGAYCRAPWIAIDGQRYERLPSTEEEEEALLELARRFDELRCNQKEETPPVVFE